MTRPRTSAEAFKGAPKWAKYAAKDKDGQHAWYRHKPSADSGFLVWLIDSFSPLKDHCDTTGIAIPGPWRDSLRRRPTAKRAVATKAKRGRK